MKNIVEVKNLSVEFKVRDGSFKAVDAVSYTHLTLPTNREV